MPVTAEPGGCHAQQAGSTKDQRDEIDTHDDLEPNANPGTRPG
jgi:hypothetical protein